MAVPPDYVPVSVYMPPEVAKFVTEYAQQQNITRRNQAGVAKPALGTAVVSLLRSQIEVEDKPPRLLTKEDIVSLGRSIALEIVSTNSIDPTGQLTKTD
jgi:hypothetical protein